MRSRDKCQRTEPIENSSDASFVLAHCLGGRQETEMGRFVPEELVTLGQQKALASRRAANALLAITNDDAAAACWEERFGPDDHVDDEGVKASRERSDSTGSAIQVDKVVAAAVEDELDDLLGEEEEDKELEDVSIFILLHGKT